jgi:hypothetical protein
MDQQNQPLVAAAHKNREFRRYSASKRRTLRQSKSKQKHIVIATVD